MSRVVFWIIALILIAILLFIFFIFRRKSVANLVKRTLGGFWEVVKKNGEIVGGIFVTFGLILIFLASFFPSAGRTALDFFWGATATGLGFIGLGMAEKADERMRAISELEFDEKMGMLLSHAKSISKTPKEVSIERVFYDTSGIIRLSKWIKSEERIRLLKTIDKIIKALNEYKGTSTYQDLKFNTLLNKLEKLKEELKLVDVKLRNKQIGDD